MSDGNAIAFASGTFLLKRNMCAVCVFVCLCALAFFLASDLHTHTLAVPCKFTIILSVICTVYIVYIAAVKAQFVPSTVADDPIRIRNI